MLLRLKTLQDRLARVSRRVWIAVGVLLLLVGAFPFWGGLVGARLARGMLARRLGVEVSIDGGRAGLSTLTLSGIRVGDEGRPALAVIDRALVPFAAAWGEGTVVVEGARFAV